MTPKRLFPALLSTALPALYPSVLRAAEEMRESAVPAGEGETVALLLAIAKVAGSLLVVVGLMLLAVYLIKKVGVGQGGCRDGRMINVLDTRMIAPKKYVAVVRIAGECVALGITDQQISLLTKVDDFCPVPEEEDSGKKVPAVNLPFAAVLKRASGLLGKKENSKTTEN